MNKWQGAALLAGICFGLYPLCLNKSGLNGNITSFCYSVVVIIVILPFALRSYGTLSTSANWWMVVMAGILAGVGVLFFNGMLANTRVQEVGILIVIATLAQITVAATYHMIQSGRITLSQAGGYLTAGLAAYLLLK